MINYPSITDPYFTKTIALIMTVISAFFIGEAVLKIISLGFALERVSTWRTLGTS